MSLSVCLSIYLSVSLSLCLSVCLSVSFSLSPPPPSPPLLFCPAPFSLRFTQNMTATVCDLCVCVCVCKPSQALIPPPPPLFSPSLTSSLPPCWQAAVNSIWNPLPQSNHLCGLRCFEETTTRLVYCDSSFQSTLRWPSG